MDNARIYKTNKIIKLAKENKLIVFTFLQYSSQLNKIYRTFKTIKNKISFQSLNAKEFKQFINEEIKKIRVKKWVIFYYWRKIRDRNK